jgi:hypothetical protein
MFGPKRDELKEGGWSLHNEMVHDFHCSEYFAVDLKKMKVLDAACSTHEVQVRCIQILMVEREKVCPFERLFYRR